MPGCMGFKSLLLLQFRKIEIRPLSALIFFILPVETGSYSVETGSYAGETGSYFRR